MAATYLCKSSVRGYHVYQSMWSAKEGEKARVQTGDEQPATPVLRHCGKRRTDRSTLAVEDIAPPLPLSWKSQFNHSNCHRKKAMFSQGGH